MNNILTVAVIILLIGSVGFAYWLMSINERITWMHDQIDDLEKKITEIDIEKNLTKYSDPAEIARLKTWTYKLIPQSLNDMNEQLEEMQNALFSKSAD